MKVAGKSKQIDLMRNTDCRERSCNRQNSHIGCIFNKSAKKKILSTLELKCITLMSPLKHYLSLVVRKPAFCICENKVAD